MAMPAPKLEDYARGMQVLLNAKAYLERRRRRFDLIQDPCTILNRAMLDISDAMMALMREKGKDARPKP
jgi:hypothetical protein